MNINLHIEKLVLDGVDLAPGKSHLLQASVETELSRLLADRGLTPGFALGVTLPRLSASGMQLTGNARQMGQQIAQAVYGGIGLNIF